MNVPSPSRPSSPARAGAARQRRDQLTIASFEITKNAKRRFRNTEQIGEMRARTVSGGLYAVGSVTPEGGFFERARFHRLPVQALLHVLLKMTKLQELALTSPQNLCPKALDTLGRPFYSPNKRTAWGTLKENRCGQLGHRNRRCYLHRLPAVAVLGAGPSGRPLGGSVAPGRET